MKSVYVVALAGLLAAASISMPASAGKLLGGLIKTGSDSGNSSSIVSTNSNGSIGVGGSNGVSVGTGGGSGGGSGGSSHFGVDNVATVDSASSGGGTQVEARVLGGGGTDIGTGDLLGNSGANVSLPDTDSLIGGLGLPDLGVPDLGDPLGGNGNGAGGDGGNGGPGGLGGLGNGGGNYPKVYYANGGGSGSVAIPNGISARLRMLLKILQDRDYLRVANGRAVCLQSFGFAQINGWLPQKDFANFNRIIPRYSQDIATLRQLLANCRNAEQRQALSSRVLKRVITLDIRNDGTPILFVL